MGTMPAVTVQLAITTRLLPTSATGDAATVYCAYTTGSPYSQMRGMGKVAAGNIKEQRGKTHMKRKCAECRGVCMHVRAQKCVKVRMEGGVWETLDSHAWAPGCGPHLLHCPLSKDLDDCVPETSSTNA